jgi:hypothetical protein
MVLPVLPNKKTVSEVWGMYTNIILMIYETFFDKTCLQQILLGQSNFSEFSNIQIKAFFVLAHFLSAAFFLHYKLNVIKKRNLPTMATNGVSSSGFSSISCTVVPI